MSRTALGSARAVCIAALCLCPACTREPAEAEQGEAAGTGPREIVVVGTVSVIKKGDRRIEAIKLTASSGEIYNVVLDQTGEKLAKDMAGKKVEVRGSVVGPQGKRELTVHTYRSKLEDRTVKKGEDDEER